MQRKIRILSLMAVLLTGVLALPYLSYRAGAQSTTTPTSTSSFQTSAQSDTDPTGLTATSTTPWRVSLSWNAPTSTTATVAGYHVYRSATSGSGYNRIASTANRTYSDTSVQPQTRYYYVVQAYAPSGYVWGNSNEVTIMTASATSYAPTNLRASSTSASQIRLNWDTPTSTTGISAFNVLRSRTQGTNYFSIATTSPSTTAYLDAGLLASTTYYYRVQSLSATGTMMGVSNDASATTAAASTPTTTADFMACVRTGFDTWSRARMTALTQYNTGVQQALERRNTAISSALAIVNAGQRNAAISTAERQWNTDLRNLRNSYRDANRASHRVMTTALDECRTRYPRELNQYPFLGRVQSIFLIDRIRNLDWGIIWM